MRVDGLAVRLRPRPMFEAADLGTRLAQAHARSVWRCHGPLWAMVTALALATAPIAGWLPSTLLFCAKPWLDRTLLFVYARAVFGEPTRWRDVRSAWRELWWRDLVTTLVVLRLSPWRAYTLPLRQLEGQRGAALRKRRELLLRGKRGAASMMQAAHAHLELAMLASAYALAAWMLPDEVRGHAFGWLTDGERGGFVMSCVYALAVGVLEPFHVASGFAMYLNRRVELEAWDVEQALRHAFGR